jgi:hypothetical protein
VISDHDKDADEHEPGDRSRIATETEPGVAPQPARRHLERDLGGLELGNAHE